MEFLIKLLPSKERVHVTAHSAAQAIEKISTYKSFNSYEIYETVIMRADEYKSKVFERLYGRHWTDMNYFIDFSIDERVENNDVAMLRAEWLRRDKEGHRISLIVID